MLIAMILSECFFKHEKNCFKTFLTIRLTVLEKELYYSGGWSTLNESHFLKIIYIEFHASIDDSGWMIVLQQILYYNIFPGKTLITVSKISTHESISTFCTAIAINVSLGKGHLLLYKQLYTIMNKRIKVCINS